MTENQQASQPDLLRNLLFWDTVHLGSTIEWLACSNPLEVVRMHGLEVPLKKTVLDLGVGQGQFARWCAGLGNRVVCCDICEIALKKVQEIAETFLVTDLRSIPPVDVGVCHLVFQHCADDMVAHILRNVNLAHDGIFSFQFAELEFLNSSDGPAVASIENGIHVFRNLDSIRRLVSESHNLRIVAEFGPVLKYWRSNRLLWWFVHCQSLNPGRLDA